MRILIVDDEPLAARGIERFCREVIGDDVESLKTYHNLTAARCHIEEEPVDLVFLDIDLNGENGFELLEALPLRSFYTIITSSHTEYAIRAFEHSVLDFLPKPFPKERFAAAIDRMRGALASRGLVREAVPVKTDEAIELVAFDDIEHLVSDRNYSILHLLDGRSERVRKTLDAFSEELPPDFVRVHRSCIARMSAMVRILHGKNNTFKLLMKSGAELPVSRSAYAKLKDEL